MLYRRQESRLTILERKRSIVGVDVVQDTLVADILLRNKADAGAHQGNPAHGFLGHLWFSAPALFWFLGRGRKPRAETKTLSRIVETRPASKTEKLRPTGEGHFCETGVVGNLGIVCHLVLSVWEVVLLLLTRLLLACGASFSKFISLALLKHALLLCFVLCLNKRGQGIGRTICPVSTASAAPFCRVSLFAELPTLAAPPIVDAMANASTGDGARLKMIANGESTSRQAMLTPTTLARLEDPRAWHARGEVGIQRSKRDPRTANDIALPMAPPLPKGRVIPVKKVVLEEDEYVERLGDIIEGDYFPHNARMLRALSGLVQGAGVPGSATPSGGGFMGTPSSVSLSTPGGTTPGRGAAAIGKGKGSTDASAGTGGALTKFVATHTSEDNQAFAELQVGAHHFQTPTNEQVVATRCVCQGRLAVAPRDFYPGRKSGGSGVAAVATRFQI